jgi:hypothetical protein
VLLRCEVVEATPREPREPHVPTLPASADAISASAGISNSRRGRAGESSPSAGITLSACCTRCTALRKTPGETASASCSISATSCSIRASAADMSSPSAARADRDSTLLAPLTLSSATAAGDPPASTTLVVVASASGASSSQLSHCMYSLGAAPLRLRVQRLPAVARAGVRCGGAGARSAFMAIALLAPSISPRLHEPICSQVGQRGHV